ncbi:MAG: ribokinase [Lentisphaerae bacterium]|jgi:ribokinase|nr:ribokinase [Lentisphaerota bacterium]
MKIINFGSLNVDYVYHLPHIVLPGETLASSSMQVNPGGKGANQSVAMIRAGATVWHAGQLGTDTEWMRDRLQKEGIDVRHIKVSGSVHGGHAIIQVDETGQNSIVLYGGANITIEPERIHEVLADAKAGDWLVLQNEINLTSELLKAGKAAGMKVCFNPAPFAPEVFDYPLDCVDLFILNEHEAAGLAKRPVDTAPEILLDELAETYPEATICLTLGADGSLLWSAESGVLRQLAYSVTAVDTTAAGDTFTGYFLAELTRGSELKAALDVASRAASIAVTRAGAMDSIPFRKELS